MAGRTHGSFRQLVADELEMLPLMNLFVALIPMLLISAVFLQVTVIDMQLPAEGADAAAPDAAGLELSLTLEERGWRLAGAGIAPAAGDESPEGAARLAALLGQVSASHPDERDITIVSAAHTRYARIVAAMDIARANGWPQIALAGADAEGSAR
jgi:biopolymer transport protein ExbD